MKKSISIIKNKKKEGESSFSVTKAPLEGTGSAAHVKGMWARGGPTIPDANNPMNLGGGQTLLLGSLSGSKSAAASSPPAGAWKAKPAPTSPDAAFPSLAILGGSEQTIEVSSTLTPSKANEASKHPPQIATAASKLASLFKEAQQPTQSSPTKATTSNGGLGGTVKPETVTPSSNASNKTVAKGSKQPQTTAARQPQTPTNDPPRTATASNKAPFAGSSPPPKDQGKPTVVTTESSALPSAAPSSSASSPSESLPINPFYSYVRERNRAQKTRAKLSHHYDTDAENMFYTRGVTGLATLFPPGISAKAVVEAVPSVEKTQKTHRSGSIPLNAKSNQVLGELLTTFLPLLDSEDGVDKWAVNFLAEACSQFPRNMAKPSVAAIAHFIECRERLLYFLKIPYAVFAEFPKHPKYMARLAFMMNRSFPGFVDPIFVAVYGSVNSSVRECEDVCALSEDEVASSGAAQLLASSNKRLWMISYLCELNKFGIGYDRVIAMTQFGQRVADTMYEASEYLTDDDFILPLTPQQQQQIAKAAGHPPNMLTGGKKPSIAMQTLFFLAKLFVRLVKEIGPFILRDWVNLKESNPRFRLSKIIHEMDESVRWTSFDEAEDETKKDLPESSKRFASPFPEMIRLRVLHAIDAAIAVIDKKPPPPEFPETLVEPEEVYRILNGGEPSQRSKSAVAKSNISPTAAAAAGSTAKQQQRQKDARSKSASAEAARLEEDNEGEEAEYWAEEGEAGEEEYWGEEEEEYEEGLYNNEEDNGNEEEAEGGDDYDYEQVEERNDMIGGPYSATTAEAVANHQMRNGSKNSNNDYGINDLIYPPHSEHDIVSEDEFLAHAMDDEEYVPPAPATTETAFLFGGSGTFADAGHPHSDDALMNDLEVVLKALDVGGDLSASAGVGAPLASTTHDSNFWGAPDNMARSGPAAVSALSTVASPIEVRSGSSLFPSVHNSISGGGGLLDLTSQHHHHHQIPHGLTSIEKEYSSGHHNSHGHGPAAIGASLGSLVHMGMPVGSSPTPSQNATPSSIIGRGGGFPSSSLHHAAQASTSMAGSSVRKPAPIGEPSCGEDDGLFAASSSSTSGPTATASAIGTGNAALGEPSFSLHNHSHSTRDGYYNTYNNTNNNNNNDSYTHHHASASLSNTASLLDAKRTVSPMLSGGLVEGSSNALDEGAQSHHHNNSTSNMNSTNHGGGLASHSMLDDDDEDAAFLRMLTAQTAESIISEPKQTVLTATAMAYTPKSLPVAHAMSGSNPAMRGVPPPLYSCGGSPVPGAAPPPYSPPLSKMPSLHQTYGPPISTPLPSPSLRGLLGSNNTGNHSVASVSPALSSSPYAPPYGLHSHHHHHHGKSPNSPIPGGHMLPPPAHATSTSTANTMAPNSNGMNSSQQGNGVGSGINGNASAAAVIGVSSLTPTTNTTTPRDMNTNTNDINTSKTTNAQSSSVSSTKKPLTEETSLFASFSNATAVSSSAAAVRPLLASYLTASATSTHSSSSTITPLEQLLRWLLHQHLTSETIGDVVRTVRRLIGLSLHAAMSAEKEKEKESCSPPPLPSSTTKASFPTVHSVSKEYSKAAGCYIIKYPRLESRELYRGVLEASMFYSACAAHREKYGHLRPDVVDDDDLDDRVLFDEDATPIESVKKKMKYLSAVAWHFVSSNSTRAELAATATTTTTAQQQQRKKSPSASSIAASIKGPLHATLTLFSEVFADVEECHYDSLRLVARVLSAVADLPIVVPHGFDTFSPPILPYGGSSSSKERSLLLTRLMVRTVVSTVHREIRCALTDMSFAYHLERRQRLAREEEAWRAYVEDTVAVNGARIRDRKLLVSLESATSVAGGESHLPLKPSASCQTTGGEVDLQALLVFFQYYAELANCGVVESFDNVIALLNETVLYYPNVKTPTARASNSASSPQVPTSAATATKANAASKSGNGKGSKQKTTAKTAVTTTAVAATSHPITPTVVEADTCYEEDEPVVVRVPGVDHAARKKLRDRIILIERGEEDDEDRENSGEENDCDDENDNAYVKALLRSKPLRSPAADHRAREHETESNLTGAVGVEDTAWVSRHEFERLSTTPESDGARLYNYFVANANPYDYSRIRSVLVVLERLMPCVSTGATASDGEEMAIRIHDLHNSGFPSLPVPTKRKTRTDDLPAEANDTTIILAPPQVQALERLLSRLFLLVYSKRVRPSSSSACPDGSSVAGSSLCIDGSFSLPFDLESKMSEVIRITSAALFSGLPKQLNVVKGKLQAAFFPKTLVEAEKRFDQLCQAPWIAAFKALPSVPCFPTATAPYPHVLPADALAALSPTALALFSLSGSSDLYCKSLMSAANFGDGRSPFPLPPKDALADMLEAIGGENVMSPSPYAYQKTAFTALEATAKGPSTTSASPTSIVLKRSARSKAQDRESPNTTTPPPEIPPPTKKEAVGEQKNALDGSEEQKKKQPSSAANVVSEAKEEESTVSAAAAARSTAAPSGSTEAKKKSSTNANAKTTAPSKAPTSSTLVARKGKGKSIDDEEDVDRVLAAHAAALNSNMTSSNGVSSTAAPSSSKSKLKKQGQEGTPTNPPPSTAAADAEPAPVSSVVAEVPSNVSCPSPAVSGPSSAPNESAERFKALGNAAFNGGNHKLAVEHFTNAIKIDPRQATYYGNRAMAHCLLGKWRKAYEDSKEALELDPGNMKYAYRCMQSLVGLGKYCDALGVFEINMYRRNVPHHGNVACPPPTAPLASSPQYVVKPGDVKLFSDVVADCFAKITEGIIEGSTMDGDAVVSTVKALYRVKAFTFAHRLASQALNHPENATQLSDTVHERIFDLFHRSCEETVQYTLSEPFRKAFVLNPPAASRDVLTVLRGRNFQPEFLILIERMSSRLFSLCSKSTDFARFLLEAEAHLTNAVSPAVAGTCMEVIRVYQAMLFAASAVTQAPRSVLPHMFLAKYLLLLHLYDLAAEVCVVALQYAIPNITVVQAALLDVARRAADHQIIPCYSDLNPSSTRVRASLRHFPHPLSKVKGDGVFDATGKPVGKGMGLPIVDLRDEEKTFFCAVIKIASDLRQADEYDEVVARYYERQ